MKRDTFGAIACMPLLRLQTRNRFFSKKIVILPKNDEWLLLPKRKIARRIWSRSHTSENAFCETFFCYSSTKSTLPIFFGPASNQLIHTLLRWLSPPSGSLNVQWSISLQKNTTILKSVHWNLKEKDKVRKSLKECGFTKAGPCWWVLAWKGTSREAARGLLGL